MNGGTSGGRSLLRAFYDSIDWEELVNVATSKSQGQDSTVGILCK